MAIQGYDKTSTYGSIATGNVIEASYFTNEFAEIFAAFAKSTSTTASGHRHDGGDAMGGYTALLSDSDNDTKISMETISIAGGAPSYTDSDTITIIAGSATIATIDSGDINVAANKGITFGDDGEKIEGDGTDLTISGNNINLTATADVNIPSGVGITFATAEKIESDGTDLSITVGSGGDINVPADIGVTFGNDGEKIEGDGTDLTISGNNINLTATADVVIPANVGVTFGTGEKIEGDSTDLTVTSGGAINLTATTDVVIPTDVGITFGSGEKIEGNDTDITVTSGADINLTATADVNIPSGVGITFGDDGEKIEGDGTDLTVSSSAILTLDAGGNIVIDADGGTVTFSDAGVSLGTVTSSGFTGNLVGDVTGTVATATVATTVTITDNESTDENNAIIFTAGGDVDGGNLGLESDGTLTYNPSTGSVTATGFVGALTGNASGTAATVTGAAQTAITSVGTLTALTVDDVAVNGKVITMTGDTGDTAVITAGAAGTLSIVTTDAAGAGGNIQITADGTVDIDSAGVLTLDSGAAINIEPAAGSAILLDGTISVDAGVVTGATSITSTAFAGALTGNVTGNASGTAATVTGAAQTAITSVGTLTALTVDDVAINGKVITMTGDTSDTVVVTAGAAGTLSIVTTDAAGADAAIQITADGTVDIDSAGILTLDSGAAINIEPAAGSAILLDGTISVDAGVVTGATSVTSTAFVGDITGDVTGTADVATVATTVTITDNESTNESNALIFTAGGDVDGGNLGLESDGTLTYNPSTGKVTATGFIGSIDINGTELILDADADTSITADTDDQIDIKIAGADDFQFTANTFTAASGSSIVQTDGLMFLGATANAKATLGFTINQGTTDDEIFALKSSGDVAHGMTSITETDTYMSIKKATGVYGGTLMQFMSDTDLTGGTATFLATGGQPDTAAGTNRAGLFRFRGQSHNGSNALANVSANGHIVSVESLRGGSMLTCFLIDEDGDTHADGTHNDSAFDDYDDVALLSASRHVTHADKNFAKRIYGNFIQEHAQVLHDNGVITMNDDGHHFVSTKGLNGLLIDCLRQTRNIQKAFYNILSDEQKESFAGELDSMKLPVLPAFQQLNGV